MLIKLLPEQVSKFWPVIKYAIEESLPPTVGEHPDKMNKILSSCLTGILDVWALYKRDGGVKIEAITVTKLLFDDASNTRSLLIYCLYGYDEVVDINWKEGLETLFKYAKSKGCSRVTAYSDVSRIITLAENFGAETRYTFISFGLG